MCLGSPYPRCSSHAKEMMDTKKSAMEQAEQEMEIANISGSRQQTAEARGKYEHTVQEFMNAKHERDLGLDNLNTLKSKINDIRVHLANPGLIPTDPSYDYSTQGLQELEEEYDDLMSERRRRIHAYDKMHGTVNGNTPSEYGTPEGVIFLREKQEEAFSDWLNALGEGVSDEETLSYAQHIEQRQEEYNHAVATFLHRRKGIIDIPVSTMEEFSVTSNMIEEKSS